MVDRAGFKVTGLNQVVRALVAMGVDVGDLKHPFSRIATEGADRAAAHSPKRSGRLARDIRGNRAKSKAVVTAGRKSIPYAGPINYGWPARNITASGFMQKADEEMRPRAVQILEDDINSKIRKRGMSR